MRGGKVELKEHCSFKTKNLVTKLHLSAYVMNNKPILCCGTKDGEIYLYEIEWQIELDPNYGENIKKEYPPENWDEHHKTYHTLKYQWCWSDKRPIG
jgi:hypothetical protein